MKLSPFGSVKAININEKDSTTTATDAVMKLSTVWELIIIVEQTKVNPKVTI